MSTHASPPLVDEIPCDAVDCYFCGTYLEFQDVFIVLLCREERISLCGNCYDTFKSDGT